MTVLTAAVVRETYEPQFWKLAFTDKYSGGCLSRPAAALSVSARDINNFDQLFTTDVHASSQTTITAGQL